MQQNAPLFFTDIKVDQRIWIQPRMILSLSLFLLMISKLRWFSDTSLSVCFDGKQENNWNAWSWTVSGLFQCCLWKEWSALDLTPQEMLGFKWIPLLRTWFHPRFLYYHIQKPWLIHSDKMLRYFSRPLKVLDESRIVKTASTLCIYLCTKF